MPGIFGWMPPAWRAHVETDAEIADTRIDVSGNVDPRGPMRGRVSATRGSSDGSGTATLSADEATSTLEASIRAEGRLNEDISVRGEVSGDNHGGWDWFSRIGRSRRNGSESLTVRANGNGATAEADTNVRAGGHRATLRGDVNTDGNWHARAGASHDIGTSTRLSEDVSVSRDGGVNISGEAEHRFGDNSRIGISGTRSDDGTTRLSGEADHRFDDSTRVRISGDRNSNGSTGLHGEVERRFGDSTRVRIGGDRNGNGDVRLSGEANHRLNDSTSIRAGRRDDGTIHAGGSFSADGNSATVDTSWSESGGVRGRVEGSTHIGGLGVSGSLTHGSGETGLSSGLTTELSNMFGTNLDFNVRGNGGVTFVEGKRVYPGTDAIGAIRRDALRLQAGDARFVEYGMRATAGANAGLSLPFGVGSGTTGLSAGRSYDVSFVRVTEDEQFATTPALASWNVPQTASRVLELAAGESFRVVGDMNHGVKGGGRISASHSLVTATLKGTAAYMLSGQTSMEVYRGAGDSVRLVTKAVKKNSRSNELKITLGANLDLGGMGGQPVAGVVSRAAEGALEDWLGAGARRSWGRSESDDRLMDVNLDLGFPVVGSAYEEALAGDWTSLRDLAKRGHPGVEMNRFVFTSTDEKTESVSHFAFGSRAAEVTTETIGRSDVFSDGAHFGVTTDLDVSSSETADWFKHHAYDVKDFSRLVSPGFGSSPGSIAPDDHWLTWSHEAREEFTSKDALLRGLGVARFLVRGDSAQALKDYERTIQALSPRTRMWLGPRNELAKTSLKIEVTIDDAGLDALCGRPENDYWNAYAQAWRSIYPDRRLPVWADPMGRRALSTHGPMSDNTADFAELYRVEQLIERLQSAPAQGEEIRNDWLRESLYENRGDEAWMAALALLGGREHLEVKVRVDSTEGASGSQFDVDLQFQGNDFKIQRDVLGF